MSRGAALALGLCAGAAAPLAAETAAGDLSVLVGTCVTCHGPDGRSSGTMPTIAGRPAEDLAAIMLNARDGGDDAGTVMPRLVRGYTEAQITALAAWFSEVGR